MQEQCFITKITEYNPTVNKNYLKRYLNLINGNYSKYDKFEKHHILPRSIWPEYEFTKENIVKLPLKAHFIAHWILTKLLPCSNEMRCAFHQMISLDKYGNSCKTSKAFEKNRKEFSEYMKTLGLERFKNGMLPLISEDARKKAKILRDESIKNGSHMFCGKNNPSHKRVAEGTHNFQGKMNPMHKLVQNGTHHWLGGEYHRNLVKEGKYHSQGDRNSCFKRLRDGSHNFLKIRPWTAGRANEKSILCWSLADLYYKLYLLDDKIGKRKLITLCKKNNIDYPTNQVSDNLIKWFRKGWIPNQDVEWLDFKNKYYEGKNKMERNEWIEAAASQYRKNGEFEENDGMISKSEAIAWATELLNANPDLIDNDPVQTANSQDLSNLFKDKD